MLKGFAEKNKYCLVCKHRLVGLCKLGHDEFCNGEDFEPSYAQTITNLLHVLNSGHGYWVDNRAINILEKFVEHLTYEEKNDSNTNTSEPPI